MFCGGGEGARKVGEWSILFVCLFSVCLCFILVCLFTICRLNGSSFFFSLSFSCSSCELLFVFARLFFSP